MRPVRTMNCPGLSLRQAEPESFLKAVAPYRDDLVVAVGCIFTQVTGSPTYTSLARTFCWMQTQILSHFQLHPINLRQKP